MFRLLVALSFGMALANAFISLRPINSLQRVSPPSTGLQAIKKYLEDTNYNEIMMSDKAVLVDCCAQWCGPCKLIDPFLVSAAEKYSDELEVVKFDVEAKNTGIKMEFLLQGVMPQALPALILFRNGQAISTHVGALSQEQLYQFIETNMNDNQRAAEKPGKKLVAAASEENKKGMISLSGMGKDDYML